MRFATIKRVVIGQRHHTGAELDPPGALGCCGDEQFGRGDDLVTGRVVLADPRLLKAEPVEPFDQFEVAADREGRVLVGWMKRCEEDAAAQIHQSRACCSFIQSVPLKDSPREILSESARHRVA
jgi:hypothetical protein